MRAISRLRRPVDSFFDKVTVNADDPNLRENRLRLLNGIREATRRGGGFFANRGLKTRPCAGMCDFEVTAIAGLNL